MSIIFRETTVRTQKLGEGIALEYDGEGTRAGNEILDAAARFGNEETLRPVVLEGERGATVTR